MAWARGSSRIGTGPRDRAVAGGGGWAARPLHDPLGSAAAASRRCTCGRSVSYLGWPFGVRTRPQRKRNNGGEARVKATTEDAK